MNKKELVVNEKRISLYGSKDIIEKETPIIENLELTGNENRDRLLIQKCIDENKLKSDILYDGNTVYPFEKTVKEYRKLQKTDSLTNMTKYMYEFFSNACGDIAHYDINGYRAYYNNSLINLENKVLKNYNFIPSWHSDLDRINKELKIGKYFDEREYINIDTISLNKLKSIIKECGWNVTTEKNYWKLEKKVMFSKNFSFDIEISNKSISNIVNEIKDYYNSFDNNEYMEKLIENRKETENSLNIRQVVIIADDIKNQLSRLADKVLYNCRLEVELNKKNITQTINMQQDDYDFDMCG